MFIKSDFVAGEQDSEIFSLFDETFRWVLFPSNTLSDIFRPFPSTLVLSPLARAHRCSEKSGPKFPLSRNILEGVVYLASSCHDVFDAQTFSLEPVL